MHLSPGQIADFRTMLLTYYDQFGRHSLPWRQPGPDGFDPYHIVVSELMLQQTQVNRVLPKYAAFLAQFPTVQALAKASLGTVLIAWQGLGYNRRAKFLWLAAQQVVRDHAGTFPDTTEGLVALPGVGKNTAGAIAAYAYNRPAVFVETNIRTVYIHHFFNEQPAVADSEIMPILEQTLDHTNPRTFYWALMDYGTYLKQTSGNAGSRSKQYVRQSPFQGSRRQVRGALLRTLASRGYTAEQLSVITQDPRCASVLRDLLQEGMVAQTDGLYHLA